MLVVPFPLVVVMSLLAGKERFFILANPGMRYIADLSAREIRSVLGGVLAGIKRDRSLTRERDATRHFRAITTKPLTNFAV